MGQTDLTLRYLVEHHLQDLLLELLGRLPPVVACDGPAARHVRRPELEVLGLERTELKIVERTADAVARVRLDGVETILHVEFQTSHTADLPVRMLVYHALLRQRHHPLPVRSVVIYLMSEPPAAPLPRGIPRVMPEDQLDFRYDVFAPWEQPIDLEALARNPALAPIAILTPGIAVADLPAVRRLITEAPLGREQQDELLLLTGITSDRRFLSDLLPSFWRREGMEDSRLYQEIKNEGKAEGRAEGRAEGEAQGEARGKAEGKAEGRAEGLRQAICALAEEKLGEVPEDLGRRLAGLDAEALSTLLKRLLRAEEREEFLACLPG